MTIFQLAREIEIGSDKSMPAKTSTTRHTEPRPYRSERFLARGDTCGGILFLLFSLTRLLSEMVRSIDLAKTKLADVGRPGKFSVFTPNQEMIVAKTIFPFESFVKSFLVSEELRSYG